MSATNTSLDFALLPALTSGSMFAALDLGLEGELRSFPATYDRAMGALHFSARMCNVPKSDGDSDVKLREAYCRAALGEFVSMEEVISYDVPEGHHGKILASQNPLLHIMKQLRNMQFHELSSSLLCEEHGVVWAGAASRMKFWYIQDISIDEFARRSRRYSREDKERMIIWFNANQRKWGVNQLILEAVSAYAREIVRLHHTDDDDANDKAHAST